MKINERQKQILVGILTDLGDYRGRMPRYEHGNHVFVTERHRIDDAKAGLVKTDPSEWLGRSLNASDYVGLNRDYKTLESRGLIERHALGYDPRRTTHLALTEAGKLLAAELAAGERNNTDDPTTSVWQVDPQRLEGPVDDSRL